MGPSIHAVSSVSCFSNGPRRIVRARRVPVIVATSDRPVGGSDGQVGVRGRGVRDAIGDVRGEAAPLRRAAGGGHELHAGRAGGGRVQAHWQGVCRIRGSGPPAACFCPSVYRL